MVLTRKQEEALKIAVERYKTGKPYTCIAGYAGTGKSTLIQFIISALNLLPEEVAYVTFTGKAASVLRQKGCENATTAHKLLYHSRRMPNGTFKFTPKIILEHRYKLIVVDEISMLPVDLWELLLSHKVHVIACGDPFQLPPIYKKTDNHVLDNPHIFLDEIMRQAQESEIIRLTLDIREGKSIPCQKGKEIQVIKSNELVDGMYHWADQIICATNKERNRINYFMRQAAGRGFEPEPGDKIICCRNCWEVTDTTGENALVNGTIGYLEKVEKKDVNYHSIYYNKFPNPVTKLYSKFKTEYEGEYENIPIDYKALITGNKALSPEQEYAISRDKTLRGTEPIEFNYGYAITCHKSQGSEWNKVLIIEEKYPFSKEEHARWLYTACTRSASKLVLVR